MKKNTNRLLLITALLFLFGNVYSQKWIPLGGGQKGEAVTKEVIEDNATTFKVNVRLNGIYDTEIATDNGSFHKLSLGSLGRLLKAGDPSLPTLAFRLAITPGTKPSVSLENEVWTDVEMGTIAPAQATALEAGSEDGIRLNTDAYGQAFLPSLVQMGKEGCWRGTRNTSVTVCPFRYYPQENRLSVLKEFQLHVDFSGASRHASEKLIRKDDLEEQRMFDNTVFAATGQTRRMLSSSSPDYYDYLIMVGNNDTILNSSKMTEFRIWKGLKGFRTKVVSCNTIGHQMSQIKQYIEQEYWNGVRYVLLVGDENSIQVPSVPSFYFYHTTVTGDYWYGCLDGDDDYQAEVLVGRFSTNLFKDFFSMVNKTIRYESNAPLSDDVLLVAHKQSPSDIYGYQYCSELIRNYNYSEPVSFITAYGSSVLSGGDEATNSDVVNAINQGVPLVNYCGFGDADFWGGEDGNLENHGWNTAEEYFYGSQCNNMDSTSCAVFFSAAPKTGDIESANNMLEKFTRARYGAAAFLGSTAPSRQVPDHHYFNRSLFIMLLDEGKYRLGEVNVLAHWLVISEFSGYDYFKDNAFSYICGGDPTLELWTSSPQSLSAYQLVTNGENVTVNTDSDSDYQVSIVSEIGDLLDRFDVYNNSFTFSRPSGNFYLAITKHNDVPRIIYYNVDADAIQNTIFTYDAYYHHTPLAIGYGVTPDVVDGDVIVKSGHRLVINNGTGGVTIDYGFECEKGASLEIIQN